MEKMPPHEALSYLTQLANDYIQTLPPSAAQPTGLVAQQAIDALRPLVIAGVPVLDMPPQAQQEGERA